MFVGDQPAPGHLGAGQTSALPRRLRDRRHFVDRRDRNGVDRKMAHHRLQYLTSEVRGKSFSNPTNAFGRCPANDGILKNIQNELVSEDGTNASTLSWIAWKRSSSIPSISSGTSASSSSVGSTFRVFPWKPTTSLPDQTGVRSYQIVSAWLTFPYPGIITWRKQPNPCMCDSLRPELPDNGIDIETFGVVDRSCDPQ
jgi:hypothetical protein